MLPIKLNSSPLNKTNIKPHVFQYFAILIALLCLSIVGCNPNDMDRRGTRVAVEGLVTLDGESLPAGRVVFVCDQGAGEVKATAAIVSGFYTFTPTNGPLVGKARVEIYSEELELEEFESVRNTKSARQLDFTKIRIPPKYNRQSTLSADVKSDLESNLISFHMTTK